MNNQDYRRMAVDLADGWEWESKSAEPMIKSPMRGWQWYSDIKRRRGYFDALAAQLREQAQSNPHIFFGIKVVDSASYVEMAIYNPNGDEEVQPLLFVANETEEALAFFKVIVDSGVLQQQELPCDTK